MQHYDNYDSLINTYIIYECIILIYEYSVCVYTHMYTYTYTNLSNTTQNRDVKHNFRRENQLEKEEQLYLLSYFFRRKRSETNMTK